MLKYAKEDNLICNSLFTRVCFYVYFMTPTNICTILCDYHVDVVVEFNKHSN